MAKLRRGAIFKSVERTKVPFSTFDLSNQSVFSARMGMLIPFMTVECVPGDRIRWNSNIFARLAPMVNPVMHRMDIRGAFFFVPYRILWSHWEEFRAEGNGDVTASQRSDYQVPSHPYWDYASLFSDYTVSDINSALLGPSTLMDYLGFPSRQIVKQRATPPSQGQPQTSIHLSGLFNVAAYYCVYDNYYRNQLLENSFSDYLNTLGGQVYPQNVPEGYYLKDGDNTAELVAMTGLDSQATSSGTKPATYKGLCYANYEHDYFTSATYSPQLGDAVTMPLAGDVKFRTDYYAGDAILGQPVVTQNSLVFHRQAVPAELEQPVIRPSDMTGSSQYSLGLNADVPLAFKYKSAQVTGTIDAGITLREFRTLQALQRYKEKLLAYGTRFQEWLLGTYAVHDGDARLDRPEFIGAFSQPIQISEVLQTSSTSSEPSPLGDYAGRGVSANQTRNFNYMAPEDGVLIGIMQITPRTSYMCGLPRSWMRLNPYDYHNPMFEHVGEQEVYANELFFSYDNCNGSDVKGTVFGYNPRFAEYKYRPDEVHGDFLEDAMLSWHLARDFSTSPTMTPGFFHASAQDRIFAVTDSAFDKFYIQSFIKMIANRPMTMYSTPI